MATQNRSPKGRIVDRGLSEESPFGVLGYDQRRRLLQYAVPKLECPPSADVNVV
jgi:hypothetical protein